ncbi:MAG TPA: serine dehydratase beta chain, partial [bacterium]|nr:serine dehydratase beta chain [bacterium]
MSNYRFDSILDIIGPEMIGPSSSHTAGAVRIGLACKSILNDKLLSVRIRLYNSFAETGSGHGTRKALLAGLMGFSKADKRIKNAEQIFKLKKIKYSIEKIYKPNNYPPNTAVINMSSKKWDIEVIG